ncbi:Redoxin domain protein [Isosphaera pallida ATCC 43644]|uniref:Redoxin domain protein n=1 Tax=Isosphaera pallida (strain ATCC 43644 / DSM 9630 / IS1B) TaxID=575540 RepID=E8R0L9_ISOPI|nr:TlpA disulfide reductase family protein [Isosphaera pallida]ADV61204.1 Redoxin domain protein [Isosphaera pallida ATCC 43644]
MSSAVNSDDPPGRTGRLILALVATVAVWFWVVRVFMPNIANPLADPKLANSGGLRQASFHWTARDLDGKEVPFSEFQGHPVFLNIWATWCPPCRAELPSINDLAARSELKEVVFLCVSVDDTRETVRQFVASTPLVPRVLWIDPTTELPPEFQTDGIPATFILDRSGSIVVSEVGAANWNAPEVASLLSTLIKRPDNAQATGDSSATSK